MLGGGSLPGRHQAGGLRSRTHDTAQYTICGIRQDSNKVAARISLWPATKQQGAQTPAEDSCTVTPINMMHKHYVAFTDAFNYVTKRTWWWCQHARWQT
jgi:hypothetical protein